jgi:hypothetical protein
MDLRAAPVFGRLCGFVRLANIPSEPIFFRTFAEFSEMGLGKKVHYALVALGDPGIGGAYHPGRHHHPGPGETHGEAGALQTGAP